MESRLKQIRKELKLTQAELAKILNCSKSNISMIETGRSALTEKNKKWLVQILNINPDWLDSGNGSILTAETAGRDMRGEQNPTDSVPLYDMDKIPGLIKLFRYSAEFKPSGHINIPYLPQCDGAVSIKGDSMNPILRSGDLVLYRQLSGPSEIFWGEMYLVSVETSTEEMIMVRYVRRSENKGMAVLAAENPQFGDREVEMSKIRAIALVKASIRMNTSK